MDLSSRLENQPRTSNGKKKQMSLMKNDSSADENEKNETGVSRPTETVDKMMGDLIDLYSREWCSAR